MLPRKIPSKPQKPRKPLKRTPLKPVSPKKLPAMRQYSAQAKAFKLANPQCQCCGVRATRDVHHSHGRGRFLLDETTWIAVCRQCHDWIHAHPGEARERGWLV